MRLAQAPAAAEGMVEQDLQMGLGGEMLALAIRLEQGRGGRNERIVNLRP